MSTTSREDPDGEALLRRAHADLDRAFRALKKRLLTGLEWGLKRRFPGQLAPYEVADLAWDAFVDMVLRLAEFETWIWAVGFAHLVARRRAIDLLRRKGRKVKVLSLPEDPERLADRGHGPSPALEAEDEVRALLAKLSGDTLQLFQAWHGLVAAGREGTRNQLMGETGWSASRLERRIRHLRSLDL